MEMDPVINLRGIVELLGTFQGILFGSLLIFRRKGHRRANVLLGLMLYVLSCTLLHQFLIDSHYISYLPQLTGFTMPLECFYGPLLFRYIQILTEPETEKTLFQNLKHFFLPGFSVLLSLPFFLLPIDNKLDIVESGYAMETWEGLTRYTLPLQMSIFALLFTVYLVLAFKKLHHHNQFIGNYFSFREKITLSWLRNLLIVMVAFWVLMSAFLAFLATTSYTDIVLVLLMLVTVVAIHYIGIMGLLQPPIFPVRTQGRSKSESATGQISTDSIPEDSTATTQTKYRHSGLTETDIKRIADKLSQLMEEDSPYLENNLALPQLAAKVGVSPNYLSQVINEYFSMKFFDYVNSYRIRFAEKLLLNPENSPKTILEIAMAAAFNSKSAFYSAFRKQTGMSPVEYRKKSLTH